MVDGSRITIQSEDVGTTVRGTAKKETNGTQSVIDLTDLSSIEIYLKDPDGIITSHTATEVTVGGADGVWAFQTESAIFTLNPGIWKVQALYTFVAGDILYSQTKVLQIGEVLS